MGVPIDGLPVVRYTSSRTNWFDACAEWLGYRPPDRQLGGNKNIAVMGGSRVKAKWLEDRFHNPLPVDAPDALVQKYARFYIVKLLGGTLFMDNGGDWISIMYLQF